MAPPLLGHSQKLLRHKSFDFLLRGIRIPFDGPADKAREELTLERQTPGSDIEEKVVDNVLIVWMHPGNCGGDGVRFADEELVAGETDPGGILTGIVQNPALHLGNEAFADRIRDGDGFLGGTWHVGGAVWLA